MNGIFSKMKNKTPTTIKNRIVDTNVNLIQLNLNDNFDKR